MRCKNKDRKSRKLKYIDVAMTQTFSVTGIPCCDSSDPLAMIQFVINNKQREHGRFNDLAVLIVAFE